MMKHDLTYEDRPCEICGKIMKVSKKSTQRFCSQECQSEWQKTRVGELNPRYTRITYTCDNCGASFVNKAYKATASNNHFCCTRCRQEWYAKVWSQKDEWKEESRKRAASLLANNPITRSRPQVIVDIILDALNITFTNEVPFGHYAVDNYINNGNLIIEVMGDYWHCNPTRYKSVSRDVQWNAIRRDISKRTYIEKNHGIHILYLWEHDIIHNTEIVQSLIQKYIQSNGILENYHSFNYEMRSGCIEIAQSVITPYQDMCIEEREKYHTKTAS